MSVIYFQFGLEEAVMGEATAISKSQGMFGIYHQNCPQIMFILIFWKKNSSVLLFSQKH